MLRGYTVFMITFSVSLQSYLKLEMIIVLMYFNVCFKIYMYENFNLTNNTTMSEAFNVSVKFTPLALNKSLDTSPHLISIYSAGALHIPFFIFHD